MDTTLIVSKVILLSRILSAIICVRKARMLNRSQVLWGVFAFVLPLIAVVIIYLMKSKQTFRYSK
jgi:hypothetical protein